MTKDDVLALDESVIDRFRKAIEIGKWANGERLNPSQLQVCMQAVVIWENAYLPVHERTGYIQKPRDDGQIVGEECDVAHEHHYPNRPMDAPNEDYQQNIAKLLTGQYGLAQKVKFKQS